MGDFEHALAQTESDALDLQRAALAVSKAAAAVVKAAKVGDVVAMERALAETKRTTTVLDVQQRNTQDGWVFDTAGYMKTGGYVAELKAVSSESGLTLYDADDRVFSYPVLVRVLSTDVSVMVDKKKTRAVRPSKLSAYLLRENHQPPKFKPADFLKALHSAYALDKQRHATGTEDPVLELANLYDILTIFPGAKREYSQQEFARDLYFLDSYLAENSGVAETNSGAHLSFHASRGRQSKLFEIVDRSGNRKVYYGISFRKDGP